MPSQSHARLPCPAGQQELFVSRPVPSKTWLCCPHAHQVVVCGEPCAHAIALHGRGGFRTALSQQLQDMWDAYVAAGQPSDWEAPGLPGVMEAVAVSYDLSAAGAAAAAGTGAAGAAAAEQYALFSSEVALDDSCGTSRVGVGGTRRLSHDTAL